MNSFHASYNHQNMNSRCIWQRWNIWANTINCMTKLTNNIIPFADASKNQETFHFLLVLAVKLVTMNEEKRWTLTEVWSLKSTFSLIVVLFLFFFPLREGRKMFHQSVEIYLFQKETYVYKYYTCNIYLQQRKNLMLVIML